MKHCMAIRAHGTHIRDRVDLIFFTNIGNLLEVMNMNKTSTKRAVSTLKVETTNEALSAKVFYRCISGKRISFVDIYGDLLR